MNKLILLLCFAFVPVSMAHPEKIADSSPIQQLFQYYKSFEGNNSLPDFDLFTLAITGHLNLKESNKLANTDIITIIDFRKPSSQKRLWVLNLASRQVLFHTLVAHGKNTGGLYAEKFSNTPNSNTSSIGFFVTDETYTGKHGLSLRLDGQESGFNELARTRAIVLHGADYVSRDFVKEHGRLGRSFGCPSVSMDVHKDMINTIKGKTSLFIFYPDRKYLAESRLIRSELLPIQLHDLEKSGPAPQLSGFSQTLGN